MTKRGQFRFSRARWAPAPPGWSLASSLVVFTLLSLIANFRAAGQELSKAASALAGMNCLDCHSADDKEGGLDLEALPRSLGDPAVEEEWTYIYDRVRRGEMPPRKKARPDPAIRSGFLTELGAALARRDAGRRNRTGRVVMRRLNRVEFENTIHDLLGIDTGIADLLPPDEEAFGFDNVAQALRLSSAQIEAYLAAGELAVDSAVRLGPRPPSKRQRFNYLEMPWVKVRLARSAREPGKASENRRTTYQALPDALVLFANPPDGLTLLRDTWTPVSGVYRVRLSAYPFQRGAAPAVATVFAVGPNTRRPLAAFTVAEKTPRAFEAIVRLERGEILDLGAEGGGMPSDGSKTGQTETDDLRVSGIAVQWVEIEGPVRAAWPPLSVRRLFPGIPLRPLGPPAHDRAFALASRNPEGDVARVLMDLAARAFRHPTSDAAVAPVVRLARQALAEGAGFEGAVRRGALAILTSPEFLFFREKPGQLDDYALASRLSYFLWSTMPDDALLREAAAGRLHESDTLRAQTERLLSSPRSQEFTRNFCGQWLGLRDIEATRPDQALYPEFDERLQRDMVRETELFFAELVRSDLAVSTLIDSDFALLNQRLAEHYRIAGIEGEQFRKAPLPAGSHRGGILTQASVLKVTANGTATSPVLRGAWVMQRILGRASKPPPPNIGSIEPDTRGATTIREQLEKHRRLASCAACHQYIDPPGFALESYDVIGGWRDRYRSLGQGLNARNPRTGKDFDFRIGPPVDSSGELSDGRKFSGIDQFKKLLLDQQEEIARNLVNQLATYATGAGVTFADRAAVDDILRRAKPKSYGLRTLIHGIVQSPLFREK